MRVLLHRIVAHAPLLVALMLFGCAHSVPLPEVRYKGVGWTASEENGKLYIIALDGEAESRALQELCPAREFYCFTSPPFAQVSVLERKKK
jgi:hypothetical protein